METGVPVMREERRAGSSAESARSAFSRSGGLRPALVGVARGEPISASAVTALLVDLSNRGYLRLRKADVAESPWVIQRCRGITSGLSRPRVRLAFYERVLLCKLFRGRRAMWLADLSRRGAALQRAYTVVARKARNAIRTDPSLRSMVDDFRSELFAVKSNALDDDTRRDYLPYVLAYSMYGEWKSWGVRAPFRLPETRQAPPPGTRPEPGPGDDVEYPPSVVADVLYAAVFPVFEKRERRRRERRNRRNQGPHHEWRDAPF